MTRDYAGSVVVPIDKVDGTLKLRRTSAAATGVLTFATAEVDGIRNTPDKVPAGDGDAIEIVWNPPTTAWGANTPSYTNMKAYRRGTMVWVSGTITLTRTSSSQSQLTYPVPLPYSPGTIDPTSFAIVATPQSGGISRVRMTKSSSTRNISLAFYFSSNQASATCDFSGFYVWR